MDSLRADAVVAGINQSHGLWERRQLCEVVLSDNQLLEFRKAYESCAIDGSNLIGSQVNPFQLVWKRNDLVLIKY